MFSSVPSLYLLDDNSILFPNCDNENYLQTLPNAPGGGGQGLYLYREDRKIRKGLLSTHIPSNGANTTPRRLGQQNYGRAWLQRME